MNAVFHKHGIHFASLRGTLTQDDFTMGLRSVFYGFCVALLLPISSYCQSGKKVIVEDLTGTWCGLCPEGSVTLNRILEDFPEAIGVSVHISDPMSVEACNQLADIYSGGGVNVFMLDRHLFEENQFVQFSFNYDEIVPQLEERIAQTAEVEVEFSSIEYDENDRLLTVEIGAEFLETIANDNFRINLWLVEDNVVRLENGYHQTNFFDAYEGHLYHGAGNPIHGFVHRNVLREAAAGAWGAEESIFGETIVEGSKFSEEFQIQVQEDWNFEELKLIGLVQSYSFDAFDRSILNADWSYLTELLNPESTDQVDSLVEDTVQVLSTIDQRLTPINNLSIYPNPAEDILFIQSSLLSESSVNEFQINVFDLKGHQLSSTNIPALGQEGSFSFSLKNEAPKLTSGVYFIQIVNTATKESSSRRLLVK